MKYLIVIIVSFFLTSVSAQVKFSVVCNQNQNKLEVIVSGNEQSYQKVIKDQFPNQRIAEEYIVNNKDNIQCGIAPKSNIPPPTTAKNKPLPKTQQPVNRPPNNPAQNQNEFLKNESTKFNQRFVIKIGFNSMSGLDDLYLGNVESGSQTLGLQIGGEFLMGKTTKVGLGLHYSSLYGTFDNLLLDVISNDENYYGEVNSFLGELFLRFPTEIGNNIQLIADLGIEYYFNVRTTLDESYEEYLIPPIDDQFPGFRIGLGINIKRLSFMFNLKRFLEFTEVTDDEKLLQFGLSTGYSF